MRGIPVRVEMGPKDIEADQAVVVRRDTREKITVALDELAAEVAEDPGYACRKICWREHANTEMHILMLLITMEELKDIADNKPGFIKAMWCGDRECEDKIKRRCRHHIHAVCRLNRKPFPTYAYAAENRRKKWYTGAKHIKKYGTQINKQRKRL